MLAFVDLLIIVNLRLYKTTKSMWEYLKKVYSQNNMAQQFQFNWSMKLQIILMDISPFKSILLDFRS